MAKGKRKLHDELFDALHSHDSQQSLLGLHLNCSKSSGQQFKKHPGAWKESFWTVSHANGTDGGTYLPFWAHGRGSLHGIEIGVKLNLLVVSCAIGMHERW